MMLTLQKASKMTHEAAVLLPTNVGLDTGLDRSIIIVKGWYNTLIFAYGLDSSNFILLLKSTGGGGCCIIMAEKLARAPIEKGA